MNSRERFIRTLLGRDVDRVPFIKVFGGKNTILPQWEEEMAGLSICIDNLLQFEGADRGWQRSPVNMRLSQRGIPVVIKETDEEVVSKWNDGTIDVYRPGMDYYRHTIEWPVKTKKDWDYVKEHHLQADDPERFPADWHEYLQKAKNRDYPLQLFHGGVYGFARTLMGDVNLAYAFYDCPELIHEIMDYYTEMVISIWTKMVRETDYDLIECWEDMACKSGMLVSSKIFQEFIRPRYLRIAQFARQYDIKIILVDSDGLIDELTELLLESGVTSIYPYEVQAGNDVAAMLERFPKLSIIGGLDKNVMAKGKPYIDEELEKAREFIQKGRYIPGPDHFVLSDVSWKDYRYFMEGLREVVMTTKPGICKG